jgi:hypothetical protein
MNTVLNTEPLDKAYELIDSALNDLKGVNIAEAGEVVNILLDLRIILDEVKAYIS